MLPLQAVHDLREPVLHVRQRHLLANRHSHKYSYFSRAGHSRRPWPSFSMHCSALAHRPTQNGNARVLCTYDRGVILRCTKKLLTVIGRAASVAGIALLGAPPLAAADPLVLSLPQAGGCGCTKTANGGLAQALMPVAAHPSVRTDSHVCARRSPEVCERASLPAVPHGQRRRRLPR